QGHDVRVRQTAAAEPAVEQKDAVEERDGEEAVLPDPRTRVEVAVLARVLEVRAAVGVADLTAPAQRIEVSGLAGHGLGVEDVDLAEVQLVQAPERQLELLDQLQLLRRGGAEVD